MNKTISQIALAATLAAAGAAHAMYEGVSEAPASYWTQQRSADVSASDRDARSEYGANEQMSEGTYGSYEAVGSTRGAAGGQGAVFSYDTPAIDG